MLLRIIVFMIAALSLTAQTTPGILQPANVSPALQQYLELTADQVARISGLNVRFRQFQGDKLRRAAQVQRELAAETAKPTLDAMAIGLRHVELEAIRRETDAEQDRVRGEVQALLTPAQRTRIAALEEVLRQYGLACDAVSNNIIKRPELAPPDNTANISVFLIGSSACGGGIGFAGFRTGDFTAAR
jgi:hypothetical protein